MSLVFTSVVLINLLGVVLALRGYNDMLSRATMIMIKTKTLIIMIYIYIYINLSVLVHIELFAGTLNISHHRLLMMEYCSTDKAYVQ